MADDVLVFEVLGPVARAVLNRPRAMNALNTPMVEALLAALDRVETDAEIRVLLLTGAGAAFCAGADLKEARAQPAVPGEPGFVEKAGGMLNRLRNFPKPVIVALNGITMAGGLELAMCADVVIAADTVQIADAHANYGVFPGAGGAAVLPRLIPLQSALYMLLTGNSLPARRLYELGLVSEIHPADQLAAAALALANHMAVKSPSSLRRMKAVARGAADKTLADALQHEQYELAAHSRSEDFHEGLRAFAEKRSPRFTGR
jgi:enoyl-CoA hydratase/carnithine racemase